MKIQPITMNNDFATYYSDLSTTAPVHNHNITFDTSYTTDPRVDEIDDPAAKTINILKPITNRHGAYCEKKPSRMSVFGACKANSIYTRELVVRSKSEANSGAVSNTFEEDLRECFREEKIRRLKAEGTPKALLPPKKSVGVRFDKVSIQEYLVQPGVNPGGTTGCPLTMEWDPIRTETFDMDVFETARCDHRRHFTQLKLVSAHREQILKQLGYSSRAIREGIRAANVTRRRRYNTIARLKSMESQAMLEDLQRNLQNLATFGSKKRREEAFLAPYVDPKAKPNLYPKARVHAN